MEVVGNEWSNDVFFAIWDDKEVMGASGVEVVLPPRTREDARLGTGRTGSALFSISVHGFGLQRVSLGLLV